MTKEEVAIVVAVASASIALGSLIWNLVLFKLSGARLQVKLVPAILDDQHTIAKGPERGWSEAMPFANTLSSWQVDLALIRVTNIGRSAVSVSNIGLDSGLGNWYKPWSRKTISLKPVQVGEVSTESTVRLEPGSMVSQYIDVWPTLRYLLCEEGSRAVAVRATATAAGRRAKRSSWRRRWRVTDTRWRLRQAHPPENAAEVAAFEELWRNASFAGPAEFPVAMLWQKMRPHLAEVKDGLELMEHLEPLVSEEYRLPMILPVCRSVAAYKQAASDAGPEQTT